MNNKKRISIFLWLLIILVIIFIVFLVKRNKANKYGINETDMDIMPEETIEYIETTKGKVIKLENFSDVATVGACLNRFYSNFYSKDMNDDNREKVYNMLAPDYVKDYGVLIQNINTDANFEDIDIEIYKIYIVTNYEGMNLYFVKGLVRDLNYNTREFENIVITDKTTGAFEVYLDNYLADHNIDIDSIDIDTEYELPTSVTLNEFNSFASSSSTMDQYAAKLFNIMKRAIVYNQDYVADMLYEGSELKNASDINSFYQNNKREVILAAYSNYEYDLENDNIIITCYNKNNTLKFTFYLDRYSQFKFNIETIDIKE